MRLKRVFISEYKNLSNFSLDFDGESFVDIFVGKNASGKSNFLEALVEIFHHIYSFDSDRPDISFSYLIAYEIEGEVVEIEWRDDALTINGRSRKTIGKTPAPENVLIYYSGHNDSVGKLVNRYEENFQRKIRSARVGEGRKIVGIDTNYKELLLSLLLIRPDACRARKYIEKKLGVKDLGIEKPGGESLTSPVIKLVLDRPGYASGSPSAEFDIKNNDESDRYWRAEGIAKEFLDQIHECVDSSPGGVTVANGYFPAEDRYILYLDIAKFQESFKGATLKETFQQFDNLKTLGMLTEISVPMVLEGGGNSSFNHFSDGQFQSVYIFAVTEIFKESECITLLDEPDAFLHPEWQFCYLRQLYEICEEATKTNHVLMSSHSASTITSADERTISLFDFDGSNILARKEQKAKIIKSLSAGLISFSEGEARLNIQHILNTTSGPVLFTEGVTDELIVETAWEKLFPDEPRPFEIQGAYDRIFLRNLFSRDELAKNYPNRAMVALFDFDEAYDDWNGLKSGEESDTLENDPLRGLCKQLQYEHHFAALIPVPDDDAIKPQVLDTDGNPWGRGADSYLPIETLFYEEELLGTWFEKQPISGGGQIIVFLGNKVDFAKEVIPSLESHYFEVFRPLFEFLIAKSEEAKKSEAA